MYFSLSFRTIAFRLIVLLAISVFVGYLLGDILISLLTTCCFILLWHYYHLFQLSNWLWQSKSISPPDAKGIWGQIYDGFYKKIQIYRKKQKQQNERIRRFRDGAEALPDAALLLSQGLAIQWGNKKAQHILGVNWPTDIGQRIDNLIRTPEFSEYLTNKKFDTPCLLVSPVDSEIHLEIRLMAYGNEDVLLLARDVSDLYRLEEMRRDFVANVSHELKTPLTVVRGYTEMVQETEHALDPHWKQVFSTMQSQISRMDRLVEQLLNLSKVENHSGDDNKIPVNMSLLITHLVTDAKWLNRDKNHQIDIDIEPGIFILGFETELKSACNNLISNAIAYTQAKGHIEISWKKMPNGLRFSVKDNGVGIRGEHLSRLTERFYRIDKSRSRDTGGSGLGLAIVKHVLNHHKAELIINSEWNKGSEFIIYFHESVLV